MRLSTESFFCVGGKISRKSFTIHRLTTSRIQHGRQKTLLSVLAASGLQMAVARNGLCMAVACMAAPEKIQVYLEEFAEPGKFGLDLHTNYVIFVLPASVTRKVFRVTPELGYGFNKHRKGVLNWLPSVCPAQFDGHPGTSGAKIRAKWRPLAPTPDSPRYGAINVDLGKLSRRLKTDQTSAEVKRSGVYQRKSVDAWY